MVNNFSIPTSSKSKQYLYINDEISIPVWSISSMKKGKTLVVTAGVHGCEYVGIEAAKQLYNEIDLEKINGTIIILPIVNVEGFLTGSKQVCPFDNKNINRIFPGTINGTVSEQIALSIENNIYPLADFLIDLHSGDINEYLTSLVFFPNDITKENCLLAREAAQYLSVNYRLPSSSKNGLYSYANVIGIPALLLEVGCRGKFTSNEVNFCKQNIYDLMAYLNIIGNGKINEKQIESLSSIYIEADFDGFWYPNIHLTTDIKKGDLLGIIKDIDDTILKKYYADFDAKVWYYTNSLGVKRNDPLIAYGKIK